MWERSRATPLPPVVETTTISPDDDEYTDGVQINPNEFDTGNRTVTITALVYCANGVDDVGTVSATIDPDITGVTDIAMTRQAGDPGENRKNYQGTFELTPCQAAGRYSVNVTATHKDGLASGSKDGDFTVTKLMAMSTTSVNFDIGAGIEPGAVATGTATVKCQGNTAIKFTDSSKVTWTKLTSENTSNEIPAANISLNTSICTWGTNITCGLTGSIGFNVTIPMGMAAETYTGAITFTPSPV